MKKKTFGSFLAASAICLSIGAVNGVAASSWNNSSANQQQISSGWASILQAQGQRSVGTQGSVSGSTGGSQGQTAFLSGLQLQSGKSSGPASASQSEDRTVDVSDSATNGGTNQSQSTNGTGSTDQSTSTAGPAHMVQAQRTTDAVFQFQGSIEGGPSLQNQMLQHHSFQFSSTIPRP
jgi:hypothetical protein